MLHCVLNDSAKFGEKEFVKLATMRDWGWGVGGGGMGGLGGDVYVSVCMARCQFHRERRTKKSYVV